MLANDGAEVYSSDIDSIHLFGGGRLHKCEGETPESCVCSKPHECHNEKIPPTFKLNQREYDSEEDFFYNFHHPNRQYEDRYKAAYLAQQSTPCYGNLVQICTVLAAIAIMGMLIAKSK
eukprot:scaffold15479_cov65-Cyclotella_meneghiniana.AAC.5